MKACHIDEFLHAEEEFDGIVIKLKPRVRFLAGNLEDARLDICVFHEM